MVQPGFGKAVSTMFVEKLADRGLVGFRGGRRESECDVAEAQGEEPVPASGLAVVIAFRESPRDDLNLTVVQPKAAIGIGDLWLEGAFVGQEDAGGAALNDGRRNRRCIDVGQRLGRKYDRGVLLAQRLQPLSELAAETCFIQREPALVDNEQCGSPVDPIADPVEEIV